MANFSVKKVYNNQEYEVALIVYSSDITITSPSNISKDESLAIPIPTQEITYIMLENSITDIIPIAQVQIIDDGFLLTSKLKKQNTRFNLKISKVSTQTVIDTFWIVKKFDILNVSTSSIQYKVWLELDCAVPLYTTCSYATSNDLYNDVSGGQNPYKIIKSILSNVGFNSYPDMSKDDQGNQILNRYSYPQTSKLVHFITNHNMYAIDAVKFLLSKAVSTLDVNPPAYLIYNMKDNKGFVTTRQNLFKANNIQQQPNSTQFPYSISEASLGRIYQMRNLKTDVTIQDFGGIQNSKLFYNYNFYKYDHKSRTWENNKVSKFGINDVLTKGSSGASEGSVYMMTADQDMEMARYYQFPTIHEQNLYDSLIRLELFSSNIQFTVQGNLDLDVGQVIQVRQTSDKNGKLEMFNGKWMIIKIRHSFRNKEYQTDLICARTYYTKAL